MDDVAILELCTGLQFKGQPCRLSRDIAAIRAHAVDIIEFLHAVQASRDHDLISCVVEIAGYFGWFRTMSRHMVQSGKPHTNRGDQMKYSTVCAGNGCTQRKALSD